jgi:glucose-6-phosphate isomerase
MSSTITVSLRQRQAWSALEKHRSEIRAQHLRELFARDPDRGERLIAEGVGLHLDYSRNRITEETIRLPVELAEECGLRERIAAMFRGEVGRRARNGAREADHPRT